MMCTSIASTLAPKGTAIPVKPTVGNWGPAQNQPGQRLHLVSEPSLTTLETLSILDSSVV